MGYVEELLASNEQVVYRTRKHWIAPLFATITGTLLAVGAIVAMFANIWIDGTVLDTLLMWGGLVALLVGLVLLGKAFVEWRSEEYVVTNHKVMKVSGILRKTAEGSALEKINDITISQSLLGRWLDFGTLSVLTAADESNLRYTEMREPMEFRKQILDQKQEYEAGDARAIAEAVRQHQAPAAPIPTQPAPTQPIPAQPAPAQPAPGSSAQEITATIERLAQLRASGAITAEEFEAKKAELLGRL